jgi:hypothetical protein
MLLWTSAAYLLKQWLEFFAAFLPPNTSEIIFSGMILLQKFR